MNPKVSVIVPIYGVEKYLRQCVDSIISQTLKNIEIILVDDGSPDGCPAIVDEYAAKDSRVVAVHQENGGYGRAVNHGIELAKGEYIGIVEPDDWIEPEMYEVLYSKAVRDSLDVIKSNFTTHNVADGFLLSLPNKWPQAPLEDKVLTVEESAVFFYYHPSIWTCIYRRSFIEFHKIRMVESKGAGWQDNPFQIQTLCLAGRIGFTRQAFYNYRVFTSSPSDALKNWRIPFERTKEIHTWLKANGFDRAPIKSWLGLRELVYLQIVAGIKEIDDMQACVNAIKSTAQALPINEMLELFPEKKRKSIVKVYSMASTNPLQLRRYVFRRGFLIRWRVLRRWLLSIRFRNGQTRIMVFGHLFVLGK